MQGVAIFAGPRGEHGHNVPCWLRKHFVVRPAHTWHLVEKWKCSAFCLDLDLSGRPVGLRVAATGCWQDCWQELLPCSDALHYSTVLRTDPWPGKAVAEESMRAEDVQKVNISDKGMPMLSSRLMWHLAFVMLISASPDFPKEIWSKRAALYYHMAKVNWTGRLIWLVH